MTSVECGCDRGGALLMFLGGGMRSSCSERLWGVGGRCKCRGLSWVVGRARYCSWFWVNMGWVIMING